MSNTPAHVGGLTALQLEGLGHYLSKGSKPKVHLYSAATLPRWLGRIDAQAQFEWHGTRHLWSETLMQDNQIPQARYLAGIATPIALFLSREKHLGALGCCTPYHQL